MTPTNQGNNLMYSQETAKKIAAILIEDAPAELLNSPKQATLSAVRVLAVARQRMADDLQQTIDEFAEEDKEAKA